MKRITIILSAFVISFTACKSVKQPARSESKYTADNTVAKPEPAETKVFNVPGTEPKAERTEVKPTPKPAPKPVQKPATAKPVSIRKEQVSFTDQSDKVKNEGNTYFVIVGSFGQLNNAKNFRTTLLEEGYTPLILHSETGFYRVCVNSYRGENEARERVAQIRQASDKYDDVWLLIKE